MVFLERFQAISDNGFTLGTVGGITFSSDVGVDIRTPGNIRFTAGVAGDFTFQGAQTELNAGDLVSFWVANEAIIDTKEDITMTVPAGTIDFHSQFETNFGSVGGMLLTSSDGDVRILSPEGTTNIHGDTIGIVGGEDSEFDDDDDLDEDDEFVDEGIHIQSYDSVLVKADREYDLFSEADIELTAGTTLTINSKINNIEFEAADSMTISAESNVISSAADEVILETLLGDLNINTDGALSMFARNLQHKATDITLSSEGSFLVDGSGLANFIAKKDLSLTMKVGMAVALESLQFRGTSDGDITFDLNALTQTSADLRVQAADLDNSEISFTAGNLVFRTANSDIHMETHQTTFLVDDDTTFTVGDFILFASRDHYHTQNQFGVVGEIEIDTGLQTSLKASRDIFLTSDSSLSFLSSDISFTASDNYEISSLLRTAFFASNIAFTATNDFELESGSFSNIIANEDIYIEGRSSNAFSATNDFEIVANDDYSVDVFDATYISHQGTMFIRADGDFDITAFDRAEVDANEDDDQFTNVYVVDNINMISGTTIEVKSGNVFTTEIPHGSADFSANDEIEFKSVDHFMTSVSGSIDFVNGGLDADAGKGIYFRSGNDFSYDNDAFSLTITSVSTDINSGTSVSMVADTLELHSDADIAFTADHTVVIQSLDDLDLSPNDGAGGFGDYDIRGGRVDVRTRFGEINISGAHSTIVETADENSIYLHANDRIEFEISEDLSFSGNDFTQATLNFYQEVDGDYNVVTTDGDLIFENVGYRLGLGGLPIPDDIDIGVLEATRSSSSVTHIIVHNEAIWNGDNFLAHSFSKDGNFELTSGTTTSITAGNSIVHDVEGYINFIAQQDISITGTDMNVNFLVNNQEYPSDVNVDGTVDWTTCDGDFRLVTGELTHSSPTLLVAQETDPCGCDDCDAGNFDIITHSEFTQTYNSLSQTYTATDNIIFNGGRVDYSALSDITLNSATEINIESLNEDDRLVDSADDKIRAASQVILTAASQITFTTVGFEEIPDTPSVEIGMEIDVHSGELNFLVPTASFEAHAPEGYVKITSGDSADGANDINIRNTRDLTIDGGMGNVVLHAYGLIDLDTATPSTAIEFNAVRHDFLIHTSQSNVVFQSSQNQNTDTRLGQITWVAGETITHIATEHDGQLKYNPLQDDLKFTIEENVMLTAGDHGFDADISMTATRDFRVTSLAEQRYLSTGPNTNEGEVSIYLLGEEGPVRFTTPADQQIYAAGHALYEAESNVLSITAADDITINSASEVYFISQFTVPIDVSSGNITLLAEGGGGSVDIISDSLQEIIITASEDIISNAEDSTHIYARTGVNMTTTFGDVTFTQNGDLQNTHVHSEGSILLRAFQPDGIQFFGSDFVGSAKRDITFDATDSFSIGSTTDGQPNTATEPIIEFHAGDGNNAGMVFDVLGGMQWTVSRRGPTVFNSDRASFTMGDDMVFESNGPIRFSAEGEFDETSFTITTQNLLTLNGGLAAELESEKAVLLDADQDITFTATGLKQTDISLIRSDNDFTINAGTLIMTSNTLEGEVIDFNVNAATIDIQNTVGDGGSWSFVSDSTISAVSQGPITFVSSGLTDIRTELGNSDILFVSAGGATVTSGGALTTEGSSIDIDAPHGSNIQSTTGDIDFVASDALLIRSNGTVTYTGFDQVVLESGLQETSLIPSHFNISSRGTLLMQAQEEFTFSTTDSGSDVYIIGDGGVTFQNSAPGRPSDQGDIYIDSENNFAVHADGNGIVTAGGNVFIESQLVDIETKGSMTYTSTGTTASILIEAEDVNMDSNHEISLQFLTGITVTAENNFNWNQINENGIGGISIVSDGADQPTTLTSSTDTFVRAGSRITGQSDQYIHFDVATSIRLETAAHGADILFSNEGTGGMNVVAGGDFLTSIPLESEVRINAFGPKLSFDTPANLRISTNTAPRNSDIFVNSNGNINFINPGPDTGSTTAFTATTSMALISNGVDRETTPQPLRRLYGISFESDDTLTFTSNTDDIRIESLHGTNNFIASEDFTINVGGPINMYSGDNVIISTGFTPQPNFQPPDRAGIVFNGLSKSSFRSNQHDLILSAEDVSWSVGTEFSVRSGFSINFASTTQDINWDASTITVRSENVDMNAGDNIDLGGGNTVEIIARESLYVGANDDILMTAAQIVRFTADNEILLTTPNGVVDISGPVFQVPILAREAGVSGNGFPNGDKYRSQEENQFPNCEERSFGFDTAADVFCYCQFNKWRCMNPDP